MKLSKSADIEGYQDSLRRGAVQGAAVGLMVSAGVATYLRTRTHFFRNAGGYQRVLVFAVPATFCGVVNMEFASRKFEEKQVLRRHGSDEQKRALDANESTKSKFTSWLSEHKYPVIVSGWAASMVGSFWLVNRDKLMTKSQKIVQARVYAQGLTVAMLLASVFLSVAVDDESDEAKRRKATYQSQSWERDIKFVETANHPHGVLASKKEREESAENLRALQTPSQTKQDVDTQNAA